MEAKIRSQGVCSTSYGHESTPQTGLLQRHVCRPALRLVSNKHPEGKRSLLIKHEKLLLADASELPLILFLCRKLLKALGALAITQGTLDKMTWCQVLLFYLPHFKHASRNFQTKSLSCRHNPIRRTQNWKRWWMRRMLAAAQMSPWMFHSEMWTPSAYGWIVKFIM